MVFEVIWKILLLKMKRILWLAIIIVSIGLVCLQISCTSTKQKQEVKFYYYPKTNVYFDVVKKDYIYSLNGGKTWAVINNTIDKEPATLGERVVIYSPVDSIWKQNEVHRKQYDGTLYNIINENNIASVGGIVTEKRAAVYKSNKARVVTNKPAPRTPKKKKTFFQKIFGKNKK